jgi:predicted outer membrane repeat protein
MQKIKSFSLVIVFTTLILCSFGSLSQRNTSYSVFTLTADNQTYKFIPQPQLGYVLKSSNSKSPFQMLDSTFPNTQKLNDYFPVTGQENMLVSLNQQLASQNDNNIRILSNMSEIKYIAPLYSLEGQTVVVIPEIIVRLKYESDYNRLEKLCQQIDCSIIKNLLYTEKEYLISSVSRNSEGVFQSVETLNSADFIEWASPSIAFQPKLYDQTVLNNDTIKPDDIYFDNQWHLDKIRAPEAWVYTAGDPNIIVAILDDGIYINHPDLKNNIWTNKDEIPGNGIDDDGNGQKDDIHGWDFCDNYNNVNPSYDGDAHGTACAGLIAAQGNNGIGVSGIAWNCTIMPIRIVKSSNFIKDETIATALRYAAVSGADILSNSWGGNTPAPVIYSAIKDITKPNGIGRNGKGCLVFFSSGNWSNGGPVVYPAKYSEGIAIGATNENDTVWTYSGSGLELDFVTPSGDTNLKGNIWTTDLPGSAGFNNRNTNILDYTDKMGGTSASCPIAAGVAALVLSINPNLTNNEAESILRDSVRDLGPSGWDASYGYGCLDVYNAVYLTFNPNESVIFVDDNAHNDPGPGDPNSSDPAEDGSQEHPFDSIQKAINHSVYKDTVTVLPGIYSGNGNYNIDFSGKVITVHSQQNPENCVIDCQNKGNAFNFNKREGTNSVIDGLTIINGNANTGGGIKIIDSSPVIKNCTFSGNKSNQGGGIYISNGSTTIDNCIFKENSTVFSGAGISIFNSSPKLSNCSFEENTANSYGGGLYENNSNLIVYDCAFIENSAHDGGGLFSEKGNIILNNCTFTENIAGMNGGGLNNLDCISSIIKSEFTKNSANTGGGIYHSADQQSKIEYITIIDCTFNENKAINNGGGINCSKSSKVYDKSIFPLITNCTFTANETDSHGGGIYIGSYTSTIQNNSFISNSAHYGGGLCIDSGYQNIKQCSFRENSADSGGGIYSYSGEPYTYFSLFVRNTANLGGGYFGEGGRQHIINCTFAENSGGVYENGRTCWIDNSILWNNGFDIYGGEIYGNTDHVQSSWADPKYGVHPPNNNDPLFADPQNGDFHLKSQAGRWNPKTQTWVKDDVTSPCIDATSSDPADEIWPHGTKRNMGAYGGTTQASLSLSNSGDIRDLNNSFSITWADILLFADLWNSTESPLRGDLNKDGIVNLSDLNFFYGNWSNNSNNIPVLSSISDKNTSVNTLLTFNVTATDDDNNILSYCAIGLTEGAQFSSQVFSWTPKQTGKYSLIFIVSDYKSLNYITVQITVE